MDKKIDETKIVYKGFVIEAQPRQLTKDKKWSIEILIWKHTGKFSKCRSFSASNTYTSKKEAIKNCFVFGKKIIDREIKNCTVEDIK